MSASIPKLTEGTQLVAKSEKLKWAAALVCIFVIAFMLRLWFNFSDYHVNCYGSCDASEYLRNALALESLKHLPKGFWSDFFACLCSGDRSCLEVRTMMKPLLDLTIAGPVFPIILFGSLVITGAPLDMGSWQGPLLVQSILTSISCVLIALIGAVSWNKKVGIVAGVLAAIYPAFIINSGRLYSESFACFLFCVVLVLVTCSIQKGDGGFWKLFFAGLAAGALQLTRSMMVMISLALIPLAWLVSRSRWTGVAAVLLGLVLTILPWYCWQKVATGQGSFTVDRVGHYNFFIGNNVDTQGWLSFPYPDGRGIEDKSYQQLLQEGYERSPSRWLRLMLDKPLRLLKFPWNDFRLSIGPVDPGAQIAVHQAILLFCFLGLSLSLFVNGSLAPTGRELANRLVLLSSLVLSLVYVCFITVPRYNLTFMPLVILFASAGLVGCGGMFGRDSNRRIAIVLTILLLLLWLVEKCNPLPFFMTFIGPPNVDIALAMTIIARAIVLISTAIGVVFAINQLKGKKMLAVWIVVASVLILFPLLCFPLRAHGRWWEWECLLDKAGDKISQEISLDPADFKTWEKGQAYLMIDAGGWRQLSRGVRIKVNNELLAGPIIPAMSFVPDITQFKDHGSGELYHECEWVLDCLTSSAGLTNLDLRQWFLLPLDYSTVAKARKSNKLKVEIEKTDDNALELFGAYKDSGQLTEVPTVDLYSWEKAFYGVERDDAFSDIRYERRFKLVDCNNRNIDLSPTPGKQSGHFSIRVLLSKQGSTTPITLIQEKLLPVKELDISSAQTVKLKLDALPNYDRDAIWLVALSGFVHATESEKPVGIETNFDSISNNKIATYNSPWSPRLINAGKSYRRFDLAFPVAPGWFSGHLREIGLKFHAVSPVLQGMNHSIPGVGKVKFEDVRVGIYKIPGVPTAAGYQIR